MEPYIKKSDIIAEIKRRIDRNNENAASYPSSSEHDYLCRVKEKVYKDLLSFLDTLEVKEVDVSNISENLAEAYEYLDYTSTGNLAHNKPMVSARLKRAIRGLFDARLFELTHDKKYRMERLGLKAQEGE